VNSENAHAIRDRIRHDPQELRLLCPRGHFIAHLALYVPVAEVQDPSTAPIRMHPRGPDKSYFGNLDDGNHGFRLAFHEPTQSYNVGSTAQTPSVDTPDRSASLSSRYS
jgi:hypothetical protein